MAFCTNCGAQLDEGAVFCSNCGAKIGVVKSEVTTEQVAYQNNYSNENGGGAYERNDYTQQIPLGEFTAQQEEFTKEDIESNKVFAVLAYFGLLFLVPLLAAKNSRFAQFHTNQGVILFITCAVCGVINIVPVIGTIVSVIGYIACFVFAIMGIVNAVKGEAKELPLIGSFKIVKY